MACAHPLFHDSFDDELSRNVDVLFALYHDSYNYSNVSILPSGLQRYLKFNILLLTPEHIKYLIIVGQ